MASHDTPPMRRQHTPGSIGPAGTVMRAEDVRRIRLAVLARWPGDARATDLSEAPYAHKEWLARTGHPWQARDRANPARARPSFE